MRVNTADPRDIIWRMDRYTGEVQMLGYRGKLTQLRIPDSITIQGKPHPITSIGDRALAKLPIRVLTIPASVKRIGDWAMSDCTQLWEVNIEGAEVMGLGVFDGCSCLCEVNLGRCLQTIGSYAFADCTNLRMLVFPDTLRELPARIFIGCTRLRRVYVPQGCGQYYHAPTRRNGWYEPSVKQTGETTMRYIGGDQ